jgi:hypothetical protein
MKPAGKVIVAILTSLALSFTAATADAWFVFNVSGPGGNPVAQVAQQIVPAQFNGAPAAFGYDYIYRVRNIGNIAIDGFSIFTGPAGLVPLTYSGTPPATNPGFLQGFGPIGNVFVPYLTGEGNTFSPVAWRFDEYDNRAAGPITHYVTHWVAPVAAPLPPGKWTEFDLFSTNSPVAGGGAVDIDGPGAIGIDLSGVASDPANSIFYATLTYNQQVTVSTTPDFTEPFAVSDQLGPGTPLPEPGSMALLVLGGLSVGLARFRRRPNPSN